jgi:hypothetical protein
MCISKIIRKAILTKDHVCVCRFLYFLMAFFPCRVCVMLDGSVIINELKKTWIEVVVPNSKVLSQYLQYLGQKIWKTTK